MPRMSNRRKGKDFENKVARKLLDLTGIQFKRHLVQYRDKGLDDLMPVGEQAREAWPFALECKASASVKTPQASWFEQVETAADNSGRLPALIYQLGRLPVRVALPYRAVVAARYGDTGGQNSAMDGIWLETDLEGFATIAREIMAWEARGEDNADAEARLKLAG